MIEFKGDCGHSVRARDEDAGKVVRCSYCGRDCLVPTKEDDSISSLFEEVERTGVFDPHTTKAERKAATVRTKRKARPGPKGDPFDPFSIAVKMGGIAILIIVLAVAWRYGKKGYDKWVADSSRPPIKQPDTTSNSNQTNNVSSGTSSRSSSGRYGMVQPSLGSGTGLYVSSVPASAEIYVFDELPRKGQIVGNSEASVHAKTDKKIPRNESVCDIAVALPVDTSQLMDYAGYSELRRAIQEGRADEAMLTDFFMPDGGELHTEQWRGFWYLVLVYDDVQIFRDEWSVVTALFLPRRSLDQLITCLPSQTRFRLDKDYINRELEFHQVAEQDRKHVIGILTRIGKVVYKSKDGSSSRLFEVSPTDGRLKAVNVDG